MCQPCVTSHTSLVQSEGAVKRSGRTIQGRSLKADANCLWCVFSCGSDGQRSDMKWEFLIFLWFHYKKGPHSGGARLLHLPYNEEITCPSPRWCGFCIEITCSPNVRLGFLQFSHTVQKHRDGWFGNILVTVCECKWLLIVCGRVKGGLDWMVKVTVCQKQHDFAPK